MSLFLPLSLGALASLWALVDRFLRPAPLHIAAARRFTRQARTRVRFPRIDRSSPSEGIQVGDLRDSGVETCQVCGDLIGVQRVRCAECGAPHHPECWDYLGSCSIYGCPSHRVRA